MLIILPPSETKRPPPDAGTPLDLDALSFPELTPMRARMIDALLATSRAPDALRRLQVGPALRPEVARNERLRDLPTRAAADTYAGPLYEGLDRASWSAETAARASGQVVIISALWGALRPDDRIPAYRLHVCARLIGVDRLEPAWRAVLPGVLAQAAAGGGPILDLRSGSYRAVGSPDGLEAETVTLRVRPAPGGAAHIGDVVAKRVRGRVASHLLASAAEPQDPLDLADRVAEHWPIEIDPPVGRQRTWTITVGAAP